MLLLRFILIQYTSYRVEFGSIKKVIGEETCAELEGRALFQYFLNIFSRNVILIYL